MDPNSVRGLSPADLEARTNYLGQLIFALFKQRREMLMSIPDLQDDYQNATTAHANDPSGENTRALDEADAALGRCRSVIQIAKKNIDAISQELGFINHFHMNAWNFTQVLLDTIEIGHSNPRSGRWK